MQLVASVKVPETMCRKYSQAVPAGQPWVPSVAPAGSQESVQLGGSHTGLRPPAMGGCVQSLSALQSCSQ
jgi:hypothetical protein